MPVDTEVVKAAFDDFEKENFVDSKTKLTAQIKVAKNDWLKNKLNLKNDVYTPPVVATKPVETPAETVVVEPVAEKPKRRSLIKKDK